MNADASAGVLMSLGVGVLAAPDGQRLYRIPVIPDIGPADPCVVLHREVYHPYAILHGGTYPRWTSTGLVHWARQPDCYRDERGGLWAPDVYAHRDGRFYLYYTVNQHAPSDRRSSPPKVIGVAEAAGPEGPFVNPSDLDGPAIDAHMFRDTDGRLYLYYVRLDRGFRIGGRPMGDPRTPAGEPAELLRPTEPWEKAHGEVTEGPWVLRRGST